MGPGLAGGAHRVQAMPLIDLSVKHGCTLEEARVQLRQAVEEVCGRFGPLVERVSWQGSDLVHLAGAGFEVDMRVDQQDVHVTGDMPALSRFLAGPLVAGLKGIVEKRFHKQLTGPGR